MFIMKNKTKGEKDISISIVNYNSTNYLIDCIKSIRKYSERLDIEILITDNASLDFKPSAIHEIFPDATISCNNKNKGFAYAHNQNFRLSNGKNFFILNPDTLLTDGCLRSLLGVFNKYPDAGIVTPTLLFGNNKANTTYKELPSIKSALFELLYINNLINALINKYPVYGLDEYFFLYFEETDFCKRVNDLLGMKIYLIKDIFVQHLYGKSSINTDFRQTIYYESYYKYFKKHFSPFKAGIIRLLIFLGGIFRFLGLNIKYFPLTKGWRVYSNKIYTSLRLIFWALGISSLSEKN